MDLSSSDDVANIKEESTDESKIDISFQSNDIKVNSDEVDMTMVNDDNKNYDADDHYSYD